MWHELIQRDIVIDRNHVWVLINWWWWCCGDASPTPPSLKQTVRSKSPQMLTHRPVCSDVTGNTEALKRTKSPINRTIFFSIYMLVKKTNLWAVYCNSHCARVLNNSFVLLNNVCSKFLPSYGHPDAVYHPAESGQVDLLVKLWSSCMSCGTFKHACTDSLQLVNSQTTKPAVILRDVDIHVNVFISCNNQWQYFSFHVDVHIVLLWMLSDTLRTKFCFFFFLLSRYCYNKISSNEMLICCLWYFIGAGGNDFNRFLN